MRNFKLYGTVVLFSLMWSSAFMAGKVAMDHCDLFVALEARFILAALLLLPFYLARGRFLTDGVMLRTSFLLGLLNNAVYVGLVFSAMHYISPGWVVIIAASSPFMTAVLAAVFGQERLNAAKLLGIAVGVCGVVIMTGVTELDADAVIGLGMAFGGTLAFSLGTVLFRGKSNGMSIQTLNFWLCVWGAVLLFPAALASGSSLANLPFSALAAIGWLVFVTVAGMWLWFTLIRSYGSVSAASCHLLNPVSGLVLAFLMLGAEIRGQDVAGALCIGLGLLIAMYGGRLAAWKKAGGETRVAERAASV